MGGNKIMTEMKWKAKTWPSRDVCADISLLTWLKVASYFRLWHMFLSVLTLALGGPVTRLNIRIASFIKTWTGRDLQSSTKQAKRVTFSLCRGATFSPHYLGSAPLSWHPSDTETDIKLCETDDGRFVSSKDNRAPLLFLMYSLMRYCSTAALWSFHTHGLFITWFWW